MVGCLLITLLKNCDRVKIACLAQLVNVIAPIMTEKDGEAWRQTTFYPFMHAANYGIGTVLRSHIECPTYDCDEFSNVPFVESVAVINEVKGELVIFAVNRSLDEPVELSIEAQGYTKKGVPTHTEISGYDVKAVNTKGSNVVTPKNKNIVKSESSITDAVLTPLSWNMIRIEIKR